MSAVTAIVVGRAAGPAHGAGAAALRRIPTHRELPQAAAAATTPLVWIRAAAAVPDERALEALLAHADAGPAVSLPVDPTGRPVERLLGRFPETDAAGLLEAARRRTVALRHAPLVSVLLDRDLVASAPAPDPRHGPYAGSVWTSHVFAAHPALLVPASTVVVTPADVLVPASPLQALRAARTGTWRRGEALRELALSLRRR